MMSSKNFPLSPAATDLGLGDQLKSQLEAEEIERKKKLLQAQGLGQGMGTAAQALFSGSGLSA